MNFNNEKNAADMLICVDIFDRQIGTSDKISCHTRPVLHRAFSVFIVNGSRMLIQRRAAGKYHSGGLWANACCSHPRDGEELSEAVTRRLAEETNIICETRELFSFIYYTKYKDNLYEYESDHVFLGEYCGEVRPDPNEIAELEWVDIDELSMRLVRQPEIFSTWFLIAAPKVIAILKGEDTAA